jgi:hypothetical protein
MFAFVDYRPRFFIRPNAVLMAGRAFEAVRCLSIHSSLMRDLPFLFACKVRYSCRQRANMQCVQDFCVHLQIHALGDWNTGGIVLHRREREYIIKSHYHDLTRQKRAASALSLRGGIKWIAF